MIRDLGPLLKWPGSKRKLAETIRRVFDAPPERYMEPCVGAACVYVQRLLVGELRPGPHVVLGDASVPLMAFYRSLRADPVGVLEAMEGFPWGAGWEREYLSRRVELNDSLSIMEAEDLPRPSYAALFLWINRACFNGLWRVNQRGLFNAPPGSYATLAPPSRGEVIAFARALDGVSLVTGDCAATLRQTDVGWQVYIDPPYLGMYDGYTADLWSYPDQVRLAGAAGRARKRGAHVVASNTDDDRLRALWAGQGFEVRNASAYHSIGAREDRREHAKELILVGRPSTP